VPFSDVPFFWTGAFGAGIRLSGHAPAGWSKTGGDGVVTSQPYGDNGVVLFFGRDNEVKAVATFAADPVAAAFSRKMKNGSLPTFDEVASGAFQADGLLKLDG